MLNAFASLNAKKNASIMYKCLIVSAFSSPSLCLALTPDGCDVTKTSPNRCNKLLPQCHIFLVNLYFCKNLKYVGVIQHSFICKRKNKTILSVLNFLHHIPQVFSESSMYSEWFEGNWYHAIAYEWTILIVRDPASSSILSNKNTPNNTIFYAKL